MYTVRLLPLEYKKMQQTIKRSNRLFFIMLIAAVSLAVILITSIAISSLYAEQLRMVKGSSQEATDRINELKTIDQFRTQVAQMQASICQIAGLSPEWESVITQVGNAVPPTVSLSSIWAAYSDQKDALTIKGSAFRHEDFSSMLENLSKIEGFGEIKFQYSTGDQAEPGWIIFQIDIQSLPAKPYELKLGGDDEDEV